MYFSEQAVSPEFRATIAALLPALGNNQAYWRFTGYLMFSVGEGGNLKIPADFIAHIEGKKRTGKYCAWDFLAAYQQDVVALDIAPHFIGTCRVVTAVHWSATVQKLLEAERRVCGGEKVLFSSGAKWRREHSAKIRAEEQAEALELMQNMGHHPAYNLLNLLNHAVPQRFTQIKKNLPDALRLVDEIDLDEKERIRQQNILHHIEQQAVPYYSPASRSVRIFSMNASVARLQRDIRKVMTRNWITADLESAQLAIVSSERCWNVPTANDFLKSGASIWQSLCDWLDVGMEAKPVLKNAVYAVIFGAGDKKIKETLDEFSPRLFRRFRSHPIIHALLIARAVQLRTIRKQGYGIDAFGTRIPIEYLPVKGKSYLYDSSRKILALIAQSYELALLSPVVQLALDYKDSTHGFYLMLWLHDGFSFVVNHPDDREVWKQRLRDAVQAQADRLGIVTRLVIE